MKIQLRIYVILLTNKQTFMNLVPPFLGNKGNNLIVDWDHHLECLTCREMGNRDNGTVTANVVSTGTNRCLPKGQFPFPSVG